MDKYTLKTIFAKSFSGLIWRMDADTAQGVLAIESRDTASGVPSFSAIDYRDGRILMLEKAYGGRNWTLAAVGDGCIVLRAFGEREPQGSGIACFSAQTGKLLWEKFNYTFLAVTAEAISARPHHIASGYITHLSFHDGEPVELITKDKDTPPPSEIVMPIPADTMPVTITANYPVEGPAYYHDFGDKEAWAFHVPDAGEYTVELLIMDGGTILDKRTLITGLKKMTPEVFFLIKRQLFFIDGNKQKIVSYLV